MPRQPDGTFQRFNNQYFGADVWQQDLETDKKIIALRHDVHDEDLATGIAECLPKDGLESMLGSLRMGGFTIINMGNGLTPTDGATFGQSVSAMSFNNGTRVLTLTRTGMSDLGETIPADGDNEIIEVGVNELIAGTGLAMLSGEDRVNPANPQDTILLAVVPTIVPGQFLNANVTVDQFGRIQFIESGVPSDLTFSIAQASVDTTFDVDGVQQVLTPAIATGEPDARAGGMSSAQAKQLADIVAGVGTDLSIGNHDQNQMELVSSTQTAPNLSLPIATTLQAGILDSATFDLIAEAAGDPDQLLALISQTSGAVTIGISLFIGGTSNLSLPLSNAAGNDAGIITGTQARQIDGLEVSGSTTKPLTITQDSNSIDINDHTGNISQIENWNDTQAGGFSGDITNVAPVGVGGSVNGFMWLVY